MTEQLKKYITDKIFEDLKFWSNILQHTDQLTKVLECKENIKQLKELLKEIE
jgi:hypothetical protein